MIFIYLYFFSSVWVLFWVYVFFFCCDKIQIAVHNENPLPPAPILWWIRRKLDKSFSLTLQNSQANIHMQKKWKKKKCMSVFMWAAACNTVTAFQGERESLKIGTVTLEFKQYRMFPLTTSALCVTVYFSLRLWVKPFRTSMTFDFRKHWKRKKVC